MSLAGCIKKHGISADISIPLRLAADRLKLEQGLSDKDAGLQAVQNELDILLAERKTLNEAILKATPELKAKYDLAAVVSEIEQILKDGGITGKEYREAIKDARTGDLTVIQARVAYPPVESQPEQKAVAKQPVEDVDAAQKAKTEKPSNTEGKIGGYPASGIGDKALTAYLQSSNEADKVAAQAEIDRRKAEQKPVTPKVEGVQLSRRIHGERPSPQDYIVPETPEFDGDMSGDLAYTPQSAEANGIKQLPIRLTVGVATAPHKGFGIEHIADNAQRDRNRSVPVYTSDENENYARHVAMMARNFNEIYADGNELILRYNNEAIVVREKIDSVTGERFYSVITIRPALNNVWGKPAWAGREYFPDDRLQQPRASTLSSDQETLRSDRFPQRNQTSYYNGTQVEPDRQPKKQPTVTYKKTRAFTIKDVNESRATTNTTSETPATIAQTLRKAFGKVADTLLKRGEKGERGGVVIAADIESLPALFEEKTGRSLNDDVLFSFGKQEEMTYEITKVGRKWLEGKEKGSRYTNKIEINSATEGWKVGETHTFAAHKNFESTGYGTTVTIHPITENAEGLVKAAQDERTISEIERWLGFIEEHAGEYHYNNGIEKVRQLGIKNYPELQARLDAAIAKTNTAQALLEENKTKLKEARVTEEKTMGKTYLNVPYDEKDTAKADGARWDAASKKWYVVGAVPAKLEKYTGSKPAQPQTLSEGQFRIGGGEGYGWSPMQEGQTLRNPNKKTDSDPLYVTVVSASKKYFKYDGMSFGVGDEQGYVYSATVRPATESEAAPFIINDMVEKERHFAKTEVGKIADQIKRNGTRPDGSNLVDGEKLLDTQTIYGGGDWFIIQPDAIWYVQNNGAGGDDWSTNNVRTGGAGAIGWKILFDQTIADRLRNAAKIIAARDIHKNDILYSKDGNVQGLFSPTDGLTFLIANYLTPETAPKVLLHEIGVHATHLGKSDAEFAKILDRIELLSKVNPKVKVARQRAIDALPDDASREDVLHETAAYLVETHKDLTISQQIIAWLRNAIRAIGKAFPVMERMAWNKWANELSPEDIVFMAHAGLRQAARGEVNAKGDVIFRSDQAERLYSQLRRVVRDLNDNIFQGSAANVKLHLMNNFGKYNLKKDEIFWTGLSEFLDIAKKVSKTDVLAFLNGNAVQVKTKLLTSDYAKVEEWKITRAKNFANRLFDDDLDAALEQAYKNVTVHMRESKNQNNTGETSRELIDGLNAAIVERNQTGSYGLAKFPTNVLPGGRDYVELLITLLRKQPSRSFEQWMSDTSRNIVDYPKDELIILRKQYEAEISKDKVSGEFISSHYPDHPNLLAHVRLDTRDDAQGRVGTFAEEFQSDWGIAGSKSGFATANELNISDDIAIKYPVNKDRRQWSITHLENSGVPREVANKWYEIYMQKRRTIPAPFVTSTTGKGSTAHTLLSMKKVILRAIEQGHEFVSWTTGAQQKDRYSLSKQVDGIDVIRIANGSYRVKAIKDKKIVIDKSELSKEDLPDLIGKDLAAKAIEKIGDEKGFGAHATYRGLELDIGGEWADTLYGDENGLDANGKPSLMTQAVSKVARQLGIELKVGGIPFEIPVSGGKYEGLTPEQMKAANKANNVEPQLQPGFTISQELKSKVTSSGMPLFSKASNKTFNPPVETSAQKFIRQHQDKHNVIKNVQNAIVEQGGIVGTEQDVYHAMERMTGIVGEQQKEFTENFVEKFMKRVAELNTTTDEIGTYLMALGAKDRNEYIQTKRSDMPDNGSGWTQAEADEVIEDYRARPDFVKFDKLARDIQKITVAKMRLLLDGKVITREQHNAMTEAMGFYVPYRGFEVIDDNDNRVGNGIGGGYSTGKKVGKQAFGRVSKAGQVVENIFRDYHAAIFLVEKAVVGEHLYNLVNDNPGTIGTIAEPEKTPSMGKSPAKYQVYYHGSLVDEFFNMNDARQFAKEKSNVNDKPDDIRIVKTGGESQVVFTDKGFDETKEVRYIKDGKELRIQLYDPVMVASYNNLNASQLGALLEAGDNLNRFLRQMYTQKNPEFIITNVFRDLQTAFAVATGEQGAGFAVRMMQHVPGAARAMWKHSKKGVADNEFDAYYAAAKKRGAFTAFAMLDDLETQALKLDAAITRHGGNGVVQAWKQGLSHKDTMLDKTGKAVSMVGKTLLYHALDSHLMMTIEHANHAAENAYRLAAFRTYIEDYGGLAKATPTILNEASRISKNLTVNFNRKGEQTRAWNAAYLFWNANVQGTQNLFRTAKTSPHKGQVQAMLAGLFGLGVFMAMMTGDDDDELTSEYDKEHNLILHYGENTIKLVLAYGLGFFFGAGYTTGSLIKGRIKPMKAAMSILGQAMGHFTPIGLSISDGEMTTKTLGVTVAPTMLSPLVMSATNTNSFGNKVVPHFSDDDGKLDRETMYRATRGTMYDKAANSAALAWADVSPETLKMMGNFLTGGVGTFVSNTAATIGDGASGEFNVERTPFIRKVWATKDVEEHRGRFYSQLEKIKKIAGEDDVKQSAILGTSAVFWQKQMKNLRDKEEVARKTGIRSEIDAVEERQTALAKKLNAIYHDEKRIAK